MKQVCHSPPPILGLFLLSFFSHSFIAAQSNLDSPQIVFIKAGRLVDTRSGEVLDLQGILIDGERIEEVGPLSAISLRVPKDATILDLSNATVLPGLIDCHTHITFQPENFARLTLEAGFTTVRDLGAVEFVDVALRNAINSGKMTGPRMQVATLTVGPAAEHADLTGLSPYTTFDNLSGVANGEAEIRKLIRFEIRRGADVIKLIATDGILSEQGSAGEPQYSQDEMNVVVQEAAIWGRKVAAHAHGAEGIKRAVRAGVASIEHGSLIDEEGIQLMKQKGTFLVADIYDDDFIGPEFKRLGYPEKILDKERSVALAQRQNFQKAMRAGVKIAFGTDAGVYPHGWNAKQFVHMVRWGMTPMQAIQSATVNAAELLGWQDRVGSIASGMFADIIGVKADPLSNITALESVDFVMKGGTIIKNRIRK